MPRIHFGEIAEQIRQQGGRSIARDHPSSHPANDEKQHRLGLLVDKEGLCEHKRQPKPDLSRFIAGYSVRQGDCEIDSAFPYWGISGTEWWT